MRLLASRLARGFSTYDWGTFAGQRQSVNFERYAKTTRRAKFLDEMDRILPWSHLCEIVRPHYPTGDGGRPSIELERMLRIHFLQQWFNLSDPSVEEALYESVSMRRFVGIDLGREAAPDETTVCKFRHLIEKHKLGEQIFRKRLLPAVLLRRTLFAMMG